MKRNKLYIAVTLTGSKLNYLIGYLENKGINVYNYKEISKTKCSVTIDYLDKRKFFAISKNMCYNITNIKYKGIYAPFVIAFKNLGVVIGCLAFIIAVYLSSDYILRVDTIGSGSYFTNEILSISKEFGVDKYKRFSKVDVKSLKNYLLSSNSELSFVSIEKKGNVVIINSIMQKGESEPLKKEQKDLISGVNGVVESINVLRGTPLVSVGDKVTKDTALIGAYILGRDEKTFPTYVVGRVTVLEEKVRFYKTQYIDDDTLKTIEAMARFLENDEVAFSEATIKDNGIEVKLTVRHIIIGG